MMNSKSKNVTCFSYKVINEQDRTKKKKTTLQDHKTRQIALTQKKKLKKRRRTRCLLWVMLV